MYVHTCKIYTIAPSPAKHLLDQFAIRRAVHCIDLHYVVQYPFRRDGAGAVPLVDGGGGGKVRMVVGVPPRRPVPQHDPQLVVRRGTLDEPIARQGQQVGGRGAHAAQLQGGGAELLRAGPEQGVPPDCRRGGAAVLLRGGGSAPSRSILPADASSAGGTSQSAAGRRDLPMLPCVVCKKTTTAPTAGAPGERRDAGGDRRGAIEEAIIAGTCTRTSSSLPTSPSAKDAARAIATTGSTLRRRRPAQRGRRGRRTLHGPLHCVASKGREAIQCAPGHQPIDATAHDMYDRTCCQ